MKMPAAFLLSISCRDWKSGTRASQQCFQLILATLVALLLVTSNSSAQTPDSIVALSKKYDDTRKNTLGPILDSLADDLKLKTVPALTRAGKADVAIQIVEAASKLKGAAIAAIPREGAPFSNAAWTALQETTEWKLFVAEFTREEATLNESYRKALEREKAGFQANGDPFGVLAVENEVKRVDGLLANGVPAGVAPAPAPVPTIKKSNEAAAEFMSSKPGVAQEKEIEARFVEKLWKVPPWKDEIHEYYFRKSGEAVRKITKTDGRVAGVHTMKWKLDSDAAVCVAREGLETKYFWFAADGSAQFRQSTKEGSRSVIELVPDGKDPEE